MDFSELRGRILVDVTGSAGDGEIVFTTASGDRFKLYHEQNCCESVLVEDIVGDLADLIGEPLTLTEETSNSDGAGQYNDDSCTWTFYKLATVRGYVTIRWYGSSNGYYSEKVTFVKLEN